MDLKPTFVKIEEVQHPGGVSTQTTARFNSDDLRSYLKENPELDAIWVVDGLGKEGIIHLQSVREAMNE